MTTAQILTERIRDAYNLNIPMEHVHDRYDSASGREYSEFQGYPDGGQYGLWARIYDDGEERCWVVFVEDAICAHDEREYFDLDSAIRWMQKQAS